MTDGDKNGGKVFLKRVQEGYQPEKGYQPTDVKPNAKPPQGGSGVPLKPTTSEQTGDSKK